MNKKLNILILEDTPTDALLVEHKLKKYGFEFESNIAQSKEDYINLLNPSYDIILADYSLPSFNALDALKMMHEQNIDIPFIVVSGTIGEDLAVSCIKEGASDYLLKDRLTRLGNAVEKAIFEKQQEKEKIKALDKLAESEEKLRTLFNTMVQGVVYQDRNYKIIWANPAAMRILGITHDNLMGKTNFDPDWQAVYEDGSPFPADKHPAIVALRTGKEVTNVMMGINNPEIKQVKWLNIHAVPLFKSTEDTPYQVYATFEDVTEKKKTENRIKLSEERFSKIFKSSPVATCITTIGDGRIIDANDNYLKLFDYSKEVLLTKTVFDLNLWNNPSEREQLIKQLMSAGYVHNVEMKAKLNSGKESDALISFDLIELNNEKCILTSAVDITERKKEDEERLKLASIVESSRDAIIGETLEGEINSWNKAASELYGYKLEEVIGKPVTILAPLQYHEEIYSKLEYIKSKGSIESFESIRKRKDGTLFNVIISKSTITNSEDKLVGISSIEKDITERVKAQNELIESEKRYRVLFEKNLSGVFRSTLEGKILEFNQAFADIFGFKDTSELSHINAIKLYHNKEQRAQLVNELREKGELKNIELCLDHKTGKKIWVLVNVTLITDNIGVNSFIQGTLFEITRRKEAIEEVIRAKEKAEEMNRLKSSFLSNMSHELRTPLIGVLGYSEILKEELNNETYKKMANTILLSGKRLLDSLNLILDLSKVEANKLDLQYKKLLVSEIVYESIKTFSVAAADKNLSINTNIKDEDCFINADEKIFLKIINNLLNNAIKYTEKGGVTIEIDCKNKEEEEWIDICVKDTGIGIHEKNLAFIFDEFRQVSEGFSRNFEGTGLGLTITKKFVEIMNGKISVNSELDKGSEFTVSFPKYSLD